MSGARAGIACLVLAIAVALPALAADEDSPFTSSKRDFSRQYKVIALAPVDANDYLQMPDAVARQLEADVTRHLQRNGFTVIPSSVLAGIRETMEAQVGGVMDPETGQTDMARWRAVREHSLRELRRQHTFDAIGIIRVDVNRVPMESDEVEWDGVKQRIDREGRRKKYTATIAVSSVSFAVFDHADRPQYVNYGGLEPLMRRVEDQLEPKDPSQFFLDEKRIREAVEVAMKPI